MKETKITARGVYKDLTITPYKITVEDGNGRKSVLRFSSQTKLNKFETEMKYKTIQLENSFKRIYGQNFDRKATNFDGLVYSMYIGNYNKLDKR